MVKDKMISKNSHEENNLYIGHSFGIGMDGDIGSDSHQSCRDDRRNANSAKNESNYATSRNIPRSDIAQSDTAAFSSLMPTLSEADVNNRAAISEQGNLFSMAQSVRNLGFIPNMNMTLNHQQINALNASLHAAGTINNVNFPSLRSSMFVPDANISLSNTNGFPNNHLPGFSADFMPLSHNRNHGPFSVTEQNIAAVNSKIRTPEQYYGTQSVRAQGSVGDETTLLHGNSSNAKNEKRGNELEVKRRGVNATGSLPIAKRSRHEDSTPAQRQLGSPSPSKWAETPGRCFSLYDKKDEDNLSQYQCLARQQMNLFEATSADAGNNAQGRNRPILPGQIGIRCKHCYKLPSKQRKTGSVYYPNRLEGVYQTAQKMTVGHLCKHCTMIPDEIREQLLYFKDQKSSDGGGKRYWANGVRSFGVIETPSGGLCFEKPMAADPLKRETPQQHYV